VAAAGGGGGGIDAEFAGGSAARAPRTPEGGIDVIVETSDDNIIGMFVAFGAPARAATFPDPASLTGGRDRGNGTSSNGGAAYA